MADYTSVARVKAQVGITDTADDTVLGYYVSSVTAEFDRRIGVFAGPSADTLRLYDGHEAVLGGTRLWIAGGIRTLTGVRIASTTGGALTAATLSDFLLRPKAQDRRQAMPAMYVQIADTSLTRFPDGYDNVELTGTFGPAAVPDDLAKLADMVVIRMWDDRGSGGLPAEASTPSRFIFASDAQMLDAYRAESFPLAS